MLDVFSRYVVGWMVAHRESGTLAERFIHETCARQAIGRAQLTIHADRGSAMTSKPVALLLADLGVTHTCIDPLVGYGHWGEDLPKVRDVEEYLDRLEWVAAEVLPDASRL